MVKYCAYCGEKISDSSIFCPYCSKKVSSQDVLSNEPATVGSSDIKVNNDSSLSQRNSEVSNDIPSGSSYFSPQVNKESLRVLLPSRFFIYTIMSFGIYPLLWFYRNNKMLNDAFNKSVSPLLRTIGLFIPIVNWIMYIFFLRNYKEILERRGLPTFSVISNFICFAFLSIVGLNIFAFLNIQEYINDLCKYENPNIQFNRQFSTLEKIWLVVVVIIYILVIILIVAARLYAASRFY